jgi:hypothetical protein
MAVGRGHAFCHRQRVETPSEYAEIWQKRYAELLGHGVPDEKARLLASELAAAAVLTSVRGRQGTPPPVPGASAAPAGPKLKMAKFDGYGLLVMGVPSMILAFFSSSVSGFVIGALVAACGWCELDGYRRFIGRLPGARPRLVGSQLALIAGAWTYAGWTLLHPEPLSPEITDLIKESGDEANEVLGMAANLRVIVAAAICGITLLYQGGLAYYYWSKTRRAD